MSHMIYCSKLCKEAPALDKAPLPGELGKKIHAHISQEAWQQWINHQTMLINEYRLSMIDPKARKMLMEEMQKFLFGAGSEKPPGYTEC